MNILQICPDSYGSAGGVSVHVRNISEQLARTHSVTVYATNSKMRYPRYESSNGVAVERFRCISPNDAYFFSWEMLLRLRKVRYDVVHAHGYHAFPFHYSRFTKNKKLIVTPHFHGVGHSSLRNSLIKLLKPFGEETLKKADKIIAVSDYEKKLICHEFGVSWDKVVVIPNGVDFKEFEGLNKQKHEFKSILYVGYLAEYKGVESLIAVLPKLSNNVILEIVGSGPLKPSLERHARELKVSGRVKFYEGLPRKELLQKFADADAFVLLSRYEAYSLVVAEALAAGTPCVVANTSALTEWIDNETCFGINPSATLNEFAELVSKVIDRKTNGHTADKWRGTKILDWREVARRLETIYY